MAQCRENETPEPRWAIGRRRRHRINRAWGPALIAGLLLVGPIVASGPLAAEENRWALTDADCQYVTSLHQRNDAQDQPAEQFRIVSGAGTYVHAEHPVEPAYVLDDLELAVWVRADRAGLQLLGKIVFPGVINPETKRPASLLVAGDSYRRVGQWQRLSLANVRRRAQRPLRVLRAKLREPLPLNDAQLHAAVLNLYGGPGATQVFVGQVEKHGFIPLDQAGAGNDGSLTSMPLQADLSLIPPKREITRLLVDGRPFFPRLIEHRGEPLKLLKQLGFNTVFLPHPATDGDLREASRHELWLVCPPPSKDDLQAMPRQSRVLAWYVGKDYAAAEQQAAADALRRHDPAKRPLIAQVDRDQWVASRGLDVIVRQRRPIGTGFELSHYGPWLEQMSRLARPGTPFWSGVQTELPASVIRQASALAKQFVASGTPVQAEQIRQMALAGIAAGARGLWFQSNSRLDDDSDETELRRMILELINNELALVKPWAMGGRQIGEIPSDNAQLRVLGLATDRSRLLIPTYVQPRAQFVVRPPSGGNRLVVAGVPESVEAFALNHIGLTRVAQKRISGGLELRLDEETSGRMILLSEDPLVINHINRVVGQTRKRVVELEQGIADRLVTEFEIRSSRLLIEDPRRITLWESARDALEQSRRLRQSRDLSAAYQFSRQANRYLSRLQAHLWSELVVDHQNPLRLPFGASFALAARTPASLDNYVNKLSWSENQLPTGDCEDLRAMVHNGWRQHQAPVPDVSTALALSPDHPYAGQHCLRISATAETQAASQSVIEVAPVWVHTAPVNVQAGQRYRVRGWIRIDQPIQGTLGGCTITDNIAGPQLAFSSRRTRGWESFEMIRAADRSDHLTVTITLHGLGEVRVDELQVEVERTAPQISQQPPSFSKRR